MQKWYELTITADRGMLPHLAGLLTSNKIKTWMEEDEGDRVRVKIYIPHVNGVEKNIKNLKRLLDADRLQVVTRAIEDEDWEKSWQQFYEIERIGRRFVIKPPWKDYNPAPGEIIIEIEPRMAFGTGYHPTTAGTLTLMEKHIRAGMDILDMGCGSGILSIAAAAMGAKGITMADYDPICTAESLENYQNAIKRHPQITRNVEVLHSDGFEKITGDFDLVMVNVHTDFLLKAAVAVYNHLRPLGLFVTGSVGMERVDEFKRRMKRLGLHFIEEREREGWMGMVFRRGYLG